MIYRVKQFLWAIVSHFKEVDYKYVDKFLDSKEKELFNKLKHNEKHHSIRVCKDAINILREKNIEIDDKKIAKLSLLHDIGKGEHSLNIFEKSTLVILNKITNGKLRRLDNIKNIDIGIAMCHFDLTCKEKGIKGEFKIVNPHISQIPKHYKYIITWIKE